ncbi:hypothetical protein H4582DRAFT_2015427, partial [Lactarius indigo]
MALGMGPLTHHPFSLQSLLTIVTGAPNYGHVHARLKSSSFLNLYSAEYQQRHVICLSRSVTRHVPLTRTPLDTVVASCSLATTCQHYLSPRVPIPCTHIPGTSCMIQHLNNEFLSPSLNCH